MNHVVIDTNIWLDLYVFNDISVQGLRQALEAKQLLALRTSAMDVECQNVLIRPHIARHTDADRLAAAMNHWHTVSQLIEPAAGIRSPWTCSDRDDQKFLDLCEQTQTRLLISKDKALLAIARRARQAGVYIVRAQDLDLAGSWLN